MRRKAQAAMEFLMTYGWAILVVLAAIGALAYFGVLSPDRFLPDKCTLQGGFSCADYKIDGTLNEIRFDVINNLGVDATGVVVALESDDCFSNTSDNVIIAGTFGNRKSEPIIFSCTKVGGIVGALNGDITIRYTRSGEDEWHIASGSITGRTE